MHKTAQTQNRQITNIEGKVEQEDSDLVKKLVVTDKEKRQFSLKLMMGTLIHNWWEYTRVLSAWK